MDSPNPKCGHSFCGSAVLHLKVKTKLIFGMKVSTILIGQRNRREKFKGSESIAMTKARQETANGVDVKGLIARPTFHRG